MLSSVQFYWQNTCFSACRIEYETSAYKTRLTSVHNGGHIQNENIVLMMRAILLLTGDQGIDFDYFGMEKGRVFKMFSMFSFCTTHFFSSSLIRQSQVIFFWFYLLNHVFFWGGIFLIPTTFFDTHDFYPHPHPRPTTSTHDPRPTTISHTLFAQHGFETQNFTKNVWAH